LFLCKVYLLNIHL